MSMFQAKICELITGEQVGLKGANVRAASLLLETSKR